MPDWLAGWYPMRPCKGRLRSRYGLAGRLIFSGGPLQYGFAILRFRGGNV